MMTTPMDSDERSLATTVAADITRMLIAGEFAPGEKLSEQQIAGRFGISRNTLREVFRILASRGLLRQIPNRGAFVAAPDAASIIDIYRVRGVIQNGAVQAATASHPAIARMGALVAEADRARVAGDWKRVGTSNMDFHRAMVELCDSPRLSACFDLVLAELRLVFGQLGHTQHLHEPYIALNTALVDLLRRGETARAGAELKSYLLKSERSVLAAVQRNRK